MREIEVDSPFYAPDLGYSYRHSVIHSRCQEWLLRLELNLSDSEITFEAVKWAISELQCIEDQSSGGGSSVGEHIEPRINLRRWRNMLIEAGGSMDEPEQNSDWDRRARVGKFVFSSALKESVMAAAGGEAGRRMAQRINAKLDVPDCVFLTKLVSHCLFVSMDQSPTSDVCAELGSSVGNEETSDWMWLHRWIVRTILPGRINDNSYTALDWLVAYMTASRGTITKLVLHDLIVDLQSCDDSDQQPPVATYIRRTGVLEYAALRWE